MGKIKSRMNRHLSREPHVPNGAAAEEGKFSGSSPFSVLVVPKRTPKSPI